MGYRKSQAFPKLLDAVARVETGPIDAGAVWSFAS